MVKNSDNPQPFGPDTLIVEAEGRIAWESLRAFYKAQGIKCLNCPAAVVESFAEGAKIHGFDLAHTLETLNQLEAESPFNGFPLTLGQRIWRKFFPKRETS